MAPCQVKKSAISGRTQNNATPSKTPPPKGTSRRDSPWNDVSQTPAAALSTAMSVMRKG